MQRSRRSPFERAPSRCRLTSALRSPLVGPRDDARCRGVCGHRRRFRRARGRQSWAPVAAGSVGGERRRGRGAHWVRALSTGQFASCDGTPCSWRGRSRGLRPRARRKRSLALGGNTRSAPAAPRASRLASHHCCAGVSWSTCRRGRAGSLFAACLAEQRGRMSKDDVGTRQLNTIGESARSHFGGHSMKRWGSHGGC